MKKFTIFLSSVPFFYQFSINIGIIITIIWYSMGVRSIVIGLETVNNSSLSYHSYFEGLCLLIHSHARHTVPLFCQWGPNCVAVINRIQLSVMMIMMKVMRKRFSDSWYLLNIRSVAHQLCYQKSSIRSIFGFFLYIWISFLYIDLPDFLDIK